MKTTNVTIRQLGDRKDYLAYSTAYDTGDQDRLRYFNTATNTDGVWQIDEYHIDKDHQTVCTTNNREAANQALLHMVRKEAEKLLEAIETPQIKDLTIKLK